MTAATTTNADRRPPLWRDVRILRVVFQVAVVGVVAAFGLWLWNNLQTNAETTNIPLSFDYLDQPADLTVPGNSFDQSQKVVDAIVVGFGNTVRIAFAGIVLATLLGTLIGIARLSTNWLLSNLARAYVELFRNIPLLIIVVFSYSAIFLQLPRLEETESYGGVFIPSIRGVGIVWFTTDGKGPAIAAVLLVAIAVAWAVRRWRGAVQDRTGNPSHGFLYGLAALVVAFVAGLVVLGFPLGFTTPELEGRRIVGGITMLPEYAALLFALVTYTASHIAEIVRGSIQAVPRGQNEAATALALSSAQRMRLIVLPQAMRIAVPALGNQYLNLTKNSSLAVAISFFELTKITQVSIANRAPAVPSYTLLLFIYLALSLTLSLLVNIANRRLALVER